MATKKNRQDREKVAIDRYPDDLGLAATPLVAAVMRRELPRAKSALKRLKKLYRETGETRYRGVTELPEHTFYDRDVFRKIAAIATVFDRLADVQRFLKYLPASEALRQQGVSQERWVQYHYATHVVLAASVPDLCLLLINATLRLGYPERLCSFDSIKSNFWCEKYGVVAPLTSVNNATKKYRERRNLYLHRGESMDIGEALGSNTYDMLTSVAFAHALSAEPLAEPAFFDAAFTSEISSMVPKLEEERKQLAQPVIELFRQLTPVYMATSTNLHAAARRRHKRGA